MYDWGDGVVLVNHQDALLNKLLDAVIGAVILESRSLCLLELRLHLLPSLHLSLNQLNLLELFVAVLRNLLLSSSALAADFPKSTD